LRWASRSIAAGRPAFKAAAIARVEPIAFVYYNNFIQQDAVLNPDARSCGLRVTKADAMDMELEKLEQNARRASTLLKVMSNPHRLMVLCQLVDNERSVGELERVVGLSQSALSQHLARLRHDGLVKTRRSAQSIYYSLAGDEASAVIATLYDLYCGTPVDRPEPKTAAMR